MPEGDKLPTIWQVISDWLGVQLPTVSGPFPKTRKNFDKALSKIVLAVGENIEVRLRRSTASVEDDTEKSRAVAQIALEKMFRSAEEQRKLENRARVLKAAHDDLQSSPPEIDAFSEIDDDWLNFFVRLAEDRSSEELGQLFGKILSGEIRKPGSFSLRTLQIMATISKSEAEKVSHLLSYAIDAIDAMGIPFETGAENRPTTEDRLLLEDVGVAGHPVRDPAMGLNVNLNPHFTATMMASKLAIVIRNHSAKSSPVPHSVPAADYVRPRTRLDREPSSHGHRLFEKVGDKHIHPTEQSIRAENTSGLDHHRGSHSHPN